MFDVERSMLDVQSLIGAMSNVELETHSGTPKLQLSSFDEIDRQNAFLDLFKLEL